MQTNKKIMLFLIPSTLMFLMLGCSIPQNPLRAIPLPHFEQPYNSSTNSSVAKRFEEFTPQSSTSVQSAIELSERYVRLSEETAVLKQKNKNSIAENGRLKNQVAALEGQLQQTQKELTEANDLLREMLIELNNWKRDITGFRQEMRAAETTQLRALLDILKFLGGEVSTESIQAEVNPENTGSSAVSPSEPAQPQLQKTLTIGE